ncbi:unnamed protein product, partial [Symbiodinium necroappetens]
MREGRGEALDKVMTDFRGATSMDEMEVVKVSGIEGRKRAMSVVTNYNGENLNPQCFFEEGSNDGDPWKWTSAWKRSLIRAIDGEDFKSSEKREHGSLKAMSPEEWKDHVKAGHYPSRTTGEDPAARGDRTKAARMKYLLVAKFTLPKSYVTGEFEPTGNDPPGDEEVGYKDLFVEEEKGEAMKVNPCGEPERDLLFDDEEKDAPDEEHVDPEDGRDDGRGVGHIPIDVEPPQSTYLLFAEPMLNDKGTTIASAIQSVVLYLQSLNIPVLVKKRRYAASGALIRLEFDERWAEGIYLGLSDQVSNGHLVYVDGIFTHTKNVKDKAKLVDAGGEGRDDERKRAGDEPDLPRARRRIVGKSTPRVATLDRSVDIGVYDDDLPEDQEEPGAYDDDLHEDQDGPGQDDDVAESAVQVASLSPRVAALDQGRAEAQSGHMESINPEDYAKEIIYDEGDVNEEVIERLFDLLPNQRLPRQTEDCGEGSLPPKAWASGVYRHGGVLGVRNSSKEFPYSTRLVNQFIRGVMGESATWSTFSLHRNLSVKRHRDSHNARDELSYLIPISDFQQGGLWTQAGVDEVVEGDEVVMVDGKRGRVKHLQSEEGSKEMVSFNPRQWHATMPWTGDRLVLAVYKVRGLNKIKPVDEDVALDLGFPLHTNDAESPRMCKLIGGEGEQPGPVAQEEAEVDLEPVEEFRYIRMSEREWNTTIARYGPDHYVEEMATRWQRIEPEEGNLNSVIPAAIAADIDRDWMDVPRIFLMSEDGQELNVGRMLGTRTSRIPHDDPEGLGSSFLKACKIYNLVTNEEEMIVFWIQRRIVVHRALPGDQRHAWRGPDEPRPPDVDPRGRAPRLAAIAVQEPMEWLHFVEVDVDRKECEGDARIMKATQDTLYTPNIEELLNKVTPENPLKVTHTVDPREVLPVVEQWVPAMKAELSALEGMPAIKRYCGLEADALRRDQNVVIVPSKLVFTVKPGVEPGTFRRKVRGVACGNFSGESAEELGDVYSAGATIDLVRLCLAEVNANPGWIAVTDDIKTAFLRAPIPELPNGRRYAMEAPKATIRAGLAQPGELWLATAAVYGFQRSPKWWSQHRNATTKKATWKSPKGGAMKVVPCITDDNLHKLVEVLPDGEHIVGYVLFYVDDTLA